MEMQKAAQASQLTGVCRGGTSKGKWEEEREKVVKVEKRKPGQKVTGLQGEISRSGKGLRLRKFTYIPNLKAD